MGLLEPEFGIGVANGHDVVGRQQYLFNCPQNDDILYQSIQRVQPPCTDHVVREDEVILREGPEA